MFDPQFSSAISSIESGGKYDMPGPVTASGDRAYGKYQVMGSNVGPWTEQFFGRRLTPEEYLASPEAQDAVFQGKFGQYVDKYGPEGAAKAWFAGEKGMNNPNAKDMLGTTVSGYAGKFMKAMGQPKGLPPAPQMLAQGPTAPMLSYGQTPINAPAGISEAPQSQDTGQAMPRLALPPMIGLPRRPDFKRLMAMMKARSTNRA